MNNLRELIISNHQMINMIRIRKNLDTSIEALRETMGISRTTADNIYKRISDGDDAIVKRDGRRLELQGNKGLFLGISIGSTYMRVVLIDLSFHPVPCTELEKVERFQGISKLDGYNEEESSPASYAFCIQKNEDGSIRFSDVQRIASEITNMFVKEASESGTQFPLLGIGFAVTGPVDYSAKTWRSAKNITDFKELIIADLIGYELMERIEAQKLFLSIDNNSKAAIVSEYQFLLENHQECYNDNVALIYIGSGVGSAMVIDQKLLRGSHNLSGELGHIRIDGNTVEGLLTNDETRLQYIPVVLNTINCLLGIDRFVLVGHSLRRNQENKELVHYLMDQRIQFTVSSTQQYSVVTLGRNESSTAAIGAAIETYYCMCNYDLNVDDGNRTNLATDISWKSMLLQG